jgi:hypothetical protein
MKIEKTADSATAAAKEMKPSSGKRIAKAGALLAVAGLTALAVAKGLKTRRGRALKKKAKAAVRKTARKAKSKARASIKRATAKRPATRGRRKVKAR